MFKIGSYVVYKRDVCRITEIKANNRKKGLDILFFFIIKNFFSVI